MYANLWTYKSNATYATYAIGTAYPFGAHTITTAVGGRVVKKPYCCLFSLDFRMAIRHFSCRSGSFYPVNIMHPLVVLLLEMKKSSERMSG